MIELMVPVRNENERASRHMDGISNTTEVIVTNETDSSSKPRASGWQQLQQQSQTEHAGLEAAPHGYLRDQPGQSARPVPIWQAGAAMRDAIALGGVCDRCGRLYSYPGLPHHCLCPSCFLGGLKATERVRLLARTHCPCPVSVPY